MKTLKPFLIVELMRQGYELLKKAQCEEAFMRIVAKEEY